MRIDDLLNQAALTKQRLTSYQKQPQAAAFSLPPSAQAKDTVNISPEAQEASRQSGGYFTQAASTPSAANAEFKEYMDRVTGRTPQPPKTTEEKIKDLTEKIKQLQSRLSEVVSNKSLPDSTKSEQVNTISAQITAAYAQLDELGKEAAGKAEEITL